MSVKALQPAHVYQIVFGLVLYLPFGIFPTFPNIVFTQPRHISKYTAIVVILNSNSNWIFIAFNLHCINNTLRCNRAKTVNQFQYPGTEKG